ncbi:MAG: hypothetical protein IKN85_12055 [Oscillospiraceae bacterium]|nr:hypothetical protein [Oscillospiraceae bacterium]MBR3536549.1 hypothetical protein [Oscillospiraceae bacterium]MBR6837360.1 hypothetical protein [Oscillospiraceae bacterium]MBR6925190.1 hypothetical protein [Oscillospiraceae bacterium]
MFKKNFTEDDIKELINESLEETIKKQADEIAELRRMVKHQSGEIYELRKKVYEEGADLNLDLTEEKLKDLSKQIAQEILAEPEEETFKRAKPFVDENGEMNTPLSRMGYVMSECTTFTQKYVSKMLRLLFGKNETNE